MSFGCNILRLTPFSIAYSAGPEWPAPKSIQNWPWREDIGTSGLANKVPTQVSYNLDGTLRKWGFLCEGEEDVYPTKMLFKLYVNPDFTDRYPNPPSNQDAAKWFRDYLQRLFEFVEQHFSNTIPRWGDKKVEYLFSIPTNWRNPALSAEIKAIAISAGFSRNKPNCRVKISLTEAEAAAVSAAKQAFERNDVIIVVDAGGGTTDINILKVTEKVGATTSLTALSVAEGVNAGSALIDMEMSKLILEGLRAVPDLGTLQDRQRLVQQILKTQFQRIKHPFGNDGTQIPTLRLSIPGLNRRDIPHLNISNGELVIPMYVSLASRFKPADIS